MRRQQQGSILTLVLLGILAVGVLATLAYGSYYQIARGTLDTVNRANSSALLTQAAYTLATEARDADADGIAEPPAGLEVSSGIFEVPASSGAPKMDAWGSPLRYCPWDNSSLNGTTTSSDKRLQGIYPALPTSVQFALVSAGPDKILNTSCEQAKTGAQGDDGVRVMTVAQMNQGVGGTYFYGDPVANLAVLTALSTTGIPPGMMRVTLDTRIPYLWNGTSWLPFNTGTVLPVVTGADCSDYQPGMLGRDTLDDLYMCKSSGSPRTWKKVQSP
jgi:hypothetical protein